MSFPGFNLHRWAGVLAGRIATDGQAEDSAQEAADALAEVLEPKHLDRLTQRLIEIRKSTDRKEQRQ